MPSSDYKRCKTCGEEKPLEEFYRHKRTKDGRNTECKECTKRRAVAWQNANPVQAAKRKQRWVGENREKVAETKRRWAAKYPERVRENSRRMREQHPEKVYARMTLNNAVRDGLIVKPKTCAACGVEPEPRELHGHHHDYSKPLEVEWLCRGCHVEEHFD
jgi:hypothetical protein